MAAASMGRQTACNQSKLSLALKTQESSPLNLFSIPSRESFGAKSEKGLVEKCSVAAAEFNSGVADFNDRGIKNPAKRRPHIPRLRNAPGFWNIPTDEKGGDGLSAGLSNPFTAGRYRSLVVEKESFPGEELEVTAWTEDDLIMAARHRKYKHLQGVQFHPESIVTSEGKTTVRNFIKMAERKEVRSKLILCNGKGHDGTINLLHLFKLLSELSILVSRVGLVECRQAGETQMNAFVRRGN